MSQTYKPTIKKWDNGNSAWDIIYPKTTIDQVISLSTALANMQSDIDGLSNPTPNQPGVLSLTEYNDYVNITFPKNSGDIEAYEIYSSIGDTNNYQLIALVYDSFYITNVSINDNTYNKKDTIYYKLIAKASGYSSTARTGNITLINNAPDVTNLRVVPSVGSFHVTWDIPSDKRVSSINVYVDYKTTTGALSKPTTPIYSGMISNYDYEIPDSYIDYYHKFWVEVVTRT